jgi:hypothetical protein
MVGNAVSTMWKGNLFCDMIDKRVKEAHNTAVEASTVDVGIIDDGRSCDHEIIPFKQYFRCISNSVIAMK